MDITQKIYNFLLVQWHLLGHKYDIEDKINQIVQLYTKYRFNTDLVNKKKISFSEILRVV